MSTIITKIQDRQYRAQWKTAYSQISNAFQVTYMENNDTRCLESENCHISSWWNPKFMGDMMSKLEVTDKCGRYFNYTPCNSNPYKQKYFDISNLNNWTSYKTLANGGMNSYDFYDFAFLLKNGVAVYFGGSHSGPIIMVDVNNANKGPNVLGRDFFGISCVPSNKCTKLIPMGGENPYPYTPYVYNGKQTACSKDIGLQSSNYVYQASGAGCAAKYLLE